MTNNPKTLIENILARADIKINGNNPWDIQIKNEEFYPRVLKNPTLALGETYMDGWWECESLDQLFCKAFHADLERLIYTDKYFLYSIIRNKFNAFLQKIINQQSKIKSLKVGKQHYDIGNDLYELMLDKQMNYSCAYWKDSQTLDEAQEAKLELICKKLYLKPGMHVLDIGCGWGAFARHAAEKHGVSVVGITISKQQQLLAQQRCAHLPIEIRFQDYRDINEKFDRVCSVGMFEHVGPKNYRQFMQAANRCLNDGGLFLLHTIGNNYSTMSANEWTNKYIFPNGNLPSIKQIGKACERLFVMEDWHNFGADYDKTLTAWQHNFNQHWEKLKNNYDERFYRMWNFYLLSSAGAFRARDIQLWQVVLAKRGTESNYIAVR